MAEFCLDCFNKYISKKKITEKDVIMDYDLCEECGEWKQCVITIKKKHFQKSKEIFRDENVEEAVKQIHTP